MVLLCNKEIPDELIDVITSHLKYDRIALQTCSLICWSFALASQRYLFHHLTIWRVREIDSQRLQDRCVRRFTELLEDIPTQLKHVQSLTMDVAGHNSSLPIIVSILERLINLTEVSLTCSNCKPDDMELVRLCCKPSVTRLHISDCTRFPGEYILSCTSLQHLGLYRSVIVSPESCELDPTPVRVPLKSFFIRPHRDWTLESFLWSNPECAVTFRNLHALAIEATHPDDLTQWAKSLAREASSVEVLAISPPYNFRRASSRLRDQQLPLLNLHLLPHLTCLVFSIFHKTSDESTMIPWIVSQLSTIPSNNRLTELQIWIYNNEHDESLFGTPVSQNLWGEHLERLDDELSLESRFNELRDVYIDVSRMGKRTAWVQLIREKDDEDGTREISLCRRNLSA
ncbi:hypothetical protein AX16_009076 [Volvariella volvacea WC 439]|nr:hypothetical protein AX16_009076 [Volvariella volvacea WC 439]